MLKVPQTAGDVFDRISILLLKAVFSDRRMEVLEELVKLSAAVADQVDDDEWIKITYAFNELCATNQDLWDLETEIRALPEDNEDRLELIAQIHQKNTDRHDSKQVINEELNSDVYEVKDYTTDFEEPEEEEEVEDDPFDPLDIS
jgi:hypothetical protein